jgi:hypothetical protein
MAVKGDKGAKQDVFVKYEIALAVNYDTAGGPLCMRNVPHYIVEADIDMTILGRPVLDEMDFDCSEHLTKVREKYHLYDSGHVGPDVTSPE